MFHRVLVPGAHSSGIQVSYPSGAFTLDILDTGRLSLDLQGKMLFGQVLLLASGNKQDGFHLEHSLQLGFENGALMLKMGARQFVSDTIKDKDSMRVSIMFSAETVSAVLDGISVIEVPRQEFRLRADSVILGQGFVGSIVSAVFWKNGAVLLRILVQDGCTIVESAPETSSEAQSSLWSSRMLWRRLVGIGILVGVLGVLFVWWNQANQGVLLVPCSRAHDRLLWLKQLSRETNLDWKALADKVNAAAEQLEQHNQKTIRQ